MKDRISKCSVLDLPKINDPRGNLTYIEQKNGDSWMINSMSIEQFAREEIEKKQITKEVKQTHEMENVLAYDKFFSEAIV